MFDDTSYEIKNGIHYISYYAQLKKEEDEREKELQEKYRDRVSDDEENYDDDDDDDDEENYDDDVGISGLLVIRIFLILE